MDRILVRLGNVIVLMLSLTLSGCAERGKVSATNIQVLSAKEYYAAAFAVSREWQADAYLKSITADARPQYDTRSTLILSYHFLSKSKLSQALLVFIREDLTIESEVVNLGGSVLDRRGIQADQWALDCMDAIRIAQDAGGNEYFRKYGSVEVTAHLEYWNIDSANLVWRISYLGIGDATLHILIDAVTGDVLEIRE